VAYKKQDIAALFSPAKKTDHAPLAVGAVYPLEACGVEVDLIQRALAAIESIQVPHPALQSRMRRVGEQKMPIETHIVVPFGSLAEFAAHEHQLLTRVAEHESIDQP